MVSLPFTFFEKRRVGELTSRITADVQQLQELIAFHFPEFLRQITTIMVGIPVIVFYYPKLSLFMLAIVPGIVVVAAFFGRRIRKLSKKNQDELADANVVADESLQNISVVKSFTNEWFETGRYKSKMNELVATAIKSAIYRGSFVSFIILGIFGAIFLVIWYGLGLIESGEMAGTGELTTFMLFTVFIGGAVGGMGDLFGQISKAIGASERLHEVLDETPESHSAEHEKHNAPDSKMQGHLVFKEVNFSYPTRKEIQTIKSISFDVLQGQTIAFAGPSGAGKTTITQLILRFFEIDSGTIQIDGKDIREIEIRELRKNIGVVPQEVILFGGTIRENILYGKTDASDAEVAEAAAQANALEFIHSFPEGLETVVGERGVKLSGGQRQRIAIARAILKNPAILILDEATSSLDSESERLVQGALDKLMENRTTIVIAHRLATIRKADKIFVINRGEIQESGTFGELSNQAGGLFQYLLSLQMQAEKHL